MKRILFLFCTAILVIFLLSGCVVLPGINMPDSGEKETIDGNSVTEPENTETENDDLKSLQEEIRQRGCTVGVAFIGYVDSEINEADLSAYIELSEAGQTYPFLLYESLFMAEGQELYAIIPANEKGRITLYPSAMTEYGEYADDKSNPLYEGKPGEIILLRCNLSEIYSNVLITADDGVNSVEFRPELSMENGRLAKISGVYDFSVYEEFPDDNSIHAAMEILMETDEVKSYMEQGMYLMYTGDMQVINDRACLLFTLGTDNEEQFVGEHYYGVCDNFIYVYDEMDGTWTTMGAG